MSWNSYGYRPYVSVAERQRNAQREMAKLAKKGMVIRPVKIEGRTIAQSFWGQAWCENLESYMDFANRLPRGRTYVRNGSVVPFLDGKERKAWRPEFGELSFAQPEEIPDRWQGRLGLSILRSQWIIHSIRLVENPR